MRISISTIICAFLALFVWEASAAPPVPVPQLTSAPIGFSINVVVGVGAPFSCWWLRDGTLLEDDGHYSSTHTTNLIATGISPQDIGGYQLIISNSSGMATSAPVQLVGHFVSALAANPVAPYTNWDSAATNIQDAIDAASTNEIVFVTNGVYAIGGKVMAGDLTNRVVLDKPLLVQSMNGPQVTTIQGNGMTNGTAAVRCAWLTNGAILKGFTLQFGATRKAGDMFSLESGGACWCAVTNAVIANCIVRSNTAAAYGGAAYQGALRNCFITGNSNSSSFGVIYTAWAVNCTIVNNLGGGAYMSTLTNSIVYFNTPVNNSLSTWAYSCSTPAPGLSNTISNPQLLADSLHLGAASPCRGTGKNVTTETDIEGRAWNNPPSMGCDEWYPDPQLITPPVLIPTNEPVGFSISLNLSGQAPFTYSWTLNGTPLQNGGHYNFADTSNLVISSVSADDIGIYQVVVSNSAGLATSAPVQIVAHYVNPASALPISPYSGWDTAATNIQDAINAASSNQVVFVTNGIYASGGRVMGGNLTNRVVLDKALLVQSMNGAAVTIIQGVKDPATNGPTSVRCAWLTNGAILNGFTLTNGSTRSSAGTGDQVDGGGAWGASTNASVVNCTISQCAAYLSGGGAYQLTLIGSTLTGNYVGNPSTTSGGGAANSNLRRCLITGNLADGILGNGGGTAGCNLFTCAVTKNSAGRSGGGCYTGTLTNCTVTGNSSAGAVGVVAAAVLNATLNNCIVQGQPTNYSGSTLTYCCTLPAAAGVGNITNDAQLLPDGIHLSSTSPCRGLGNPNTKIGTDIDGQAWNSPSSIGCDEWQPPALIGGQPAYQTGPAFGALTIVAAGAGQPPFTCYWTKDGVSLSDDGHFSNSASTNLMISHFGPDDGGGYQVVVSNAYGVSTSQVTQVTIHAVDANGANPVPPYLSWVTAATNIQNAIDAAAAGDIVLVTNGLYASGGKVMTPDLTNRVVLDKALVVQSVNGYSVTTIQGSADPTITNGPLAVRCAWLTNGAVLSGFRLMNGGTRSGPSTFVQANYDGGGVWCSANAVVANCELTNNTADLGGGVIFGNLNNCLIIGNKATFEGGGAYFANLSNCTVVNNWCGTLGGGGGIYVGTARNCILQDNVSDSISLPLFNDNYHQATLTYCLSSPFASGAGNITGLATFVDYAHITSDSPGRGVGNSLYASGTDMDGEPWASPPSMGCDEVIDANLTGPLSIVAIQTPYTNTVANSINGKLYFRAYFTGNVSHLQWSFGDGVVTNGGYAMNHIWSAPGDYVLTLTAFNADNPGGVSATLPIHVDPLVQPNLRFLGVVSNKLQFQFNRQPLPLYTVQYTTSLAPPVSWQTFSIVFGSLVGGVTNITDTLPTNGNRYYRVMAK